MKRAPRSTGGGRGLSKFKGKGTMNASCTSEAEVRSRYSKRDTAMGRGERQGKERKCLEEEG